MRAPTVLSSGFLALLSISVGAFVACADGSADDSPPLTQSDAGSDSSNSETSGEDTAPPGPANDFPEAPIFDKAPSSAATLFGPAGSGAATGGPCLIEPQVGSLFPRNFLRPRFKFSAPDGHNLFEIRLHTETQKNDLVVYTIEKTWVMPSEIWNGISARSLDTPITMTVRSGKYDLGSDKLTDGVFVGSTGTFTIAPAEAGGTIVYWVLPGGGSTVSHLKGFNVGDETVKDVLDPSKIPGSQCIGCHTSTPDGQAVAMSSSTVAGDGSGPSHIEIRKLSDNTVPSFISASGLAMLGRLDQHAVAFSKGHWSSGDHMMLSALVVDGKRQILWTDLEASSDARGTGWDVIARTGDSKAAGGPAWSHDGKNIVYFSAPDIGAGIIDGAGQSDLMIVPYGDKKGGAATPLYNDVAYSSFYPQFSADDALVAFTRTARGQTTYNNKNAEIMVIPTSGGMPTRLVANDPGTCVGGTSPGVTNSWPKWSPMAIESGGKKYYWLTFASTRGAGNPQLYVAPIVKSGDTITTYPALYLWNQPENEHNHTPAWDVFALPVK
jgi:hypothetical protein